MNLNSYTTISPFKNRSNASSIPRIIFVAVLLALVTAMPAAASTTLVTQNTDLNFGVISQNDLGGQGNYATAYDNFRINGDYKLTFMQWTGSYYNPAQQGPITGWTVTFYNDNGGQPGGACCTVQVAGTANESFLGFDHVGDPTFNYSLDLGGICCFLNGVEYWVSVVPDLQYPPEWAWESSSDGDGISYQDYYSQRLFHNNDLAFSLVGDPCDPTPEPGSLVMLGSGLLATAGAIRRRCTVNSSD